MTGKVTPGGFNMGSQQEVKQVQLLWLQFPPATQWFTSCTGRALPVILHLLLPLWVSHTHTLTPAAPHAAWLKDTAPVISMLL